MSEERTPPPSPGIDIEEELKRSYLDYAMSVIVGRALPDVRDGLKPVHRRVLYGMWESGNRAGRPYKKSARIVGDVMGRYHPHGDSAIYDTVVRLAQDFSMRYPLVDGQGNFGSLDGDSPAAMRYTEIRLTRLAEEMLREDIDKETVDWLPNYDGSETEPTVLPARIPNLLVNGSAGIAVGMATNIPPHNLTEVIDAVVLLIDRPDATFHDLLEVVKGPDFPTGATIHGVQGIHDAYLTGRGTVYIRAKADVEDLGKDRQAIIVSEIPYQVNKARLLEKIAELVKTKRIEGISDLRDESDRDGIRIVIELKRGEIGEVLLNSLYKQTQLQTSFGINMRAIVDQQPRVLSLRQVLEYFLDHRRTVVIRRVRFDLKKAEAQAHLLEGLLKALDIIDEIIATIRASHAPADAKIALIENWAFSPVQAQAILDMRLQKLTGLEREKLIAEYQDLMTLIERLRAILGSDELLLAEIRGELLEIRDKYGDARRTAIEIASADITIEDLIADEDMVVTVSRLGYIKRTPLAAYREQRRGGKGRKGMEPREGDWVDHIFVASAHSYVLVFTASGRVHWIKVHQIPEYEPAARGKAIVNLLELDPSERVASTVVVKDFEEGRLVFVTERGTVKKTELSAYRHPRVGGIIAIRIDEGDALLDVRRTDGERDIFLATRAGQSIRFPASDVRTMGRTARGVRGISLRGDDRVVSLATLEPEGTILTVSELGYGKRTELGEYRVQGRGGYGIINLKVSEKTGAVVGVRQIRDDQGIMLVTHAGKVIRSSVEDVRIIGRSTQGVKVMDLTGDDRVVALAKFDRDDEEEELDELAVDPDAPTDADSADPDSTPNDDEPTVH